MDLFNPVSLVIDVTSMKESGFMEHREKVVVRFSYTICSSKGFVVYFVGSSRSGD